MNEDSTEMVDARLWAVDGRLWSVDGRLWSVYKCSQFNKNETVDKLRPKAKSK